MIRKDEASYVVADPPFYPVYPLQSGARDGWQLPASLWANLPGSLWRSLLAFARSTDFHKKSALRSLFKHPIHSSKRGRSTSQRSDTGKGNAAHGLLR